MRFFRVSLVLVTAALLTACAGHDLAPPKNGFQKLENPRAASLGIYPYDDDGKPSTTERITCIPAGRAVKCAQQEDDFIRYNQQQVLRNYPPQPGYGYRPSYQERQIQRGGYYGGTGFWIDKSCGGILAPLRSDCP